ncbi:hypothetical protein MUK70_03665 [Dyadobacter chenwenxiniae]|uniref:Uncharacterized protein n=1 Tax=Dyadobacter chenwenxiniae TaxID=2906456 RepID=A0A9X1PR12_9BACT|nr:hypothetical protein [Dyadobacter chenwenxiniae]MCF0065842.1 hypothetical protein [Dyadobacter chenwenxiniae]UON84088.1 hypothetical protein MUK70_03665 [Dyadobacter chenwenxiniae]
MILFWILWAFCAGILLVLLYLFRDSVYTTPGGPPASFYRAAVIAIGLPAIALPASLWLVSNGFQLAAKLLLLLPDLPGLAFLLFLLIYQFSDGRKN